VIGGSALKAWRLGQIAQKSELSRVLPFAEA
jgi:hypothetical protein